MSIGLTMQTTSSAGPKKSWSNIYLLGLSHFVSDYYCNILPVMLPFFAAKFGLSYSASGLLYMIFQITASFIQPPIGILADRYRINYLMPLSILTGGITICAVGFAPNAWILYLIVFASGICASGFHPLAGGIVPLVAPEKRLVMSTSIFIAGGNIGFAVGPLLTAMFLERFLPEELLYLAIPGIITACLVFSRKLHVKNVVPPKEETVSVASLLRNRNFLMLVSSAVFRSICYCGSLIYLPLLMVSKGYSTVEAASLLLAMLLGTVAGGLSIGALGSRFKLKTLMLATFVGTFVFFSIFLYKLDLSPVSYIALFLSGALCYGSTPLAIVWSQRLLPNCAAFSASMMLGFTFGVGYLLSGLIGIIGDIFNLHFAFAVTTLPSLIIAILIMLVLKEPAVKKTE